MLNNEIEKKNNKIKLRMKGYFIVKGLVPYSYKNLTNITIYTF